MLKVLKIIARRVKRIREVLETLEVLTANDYDILTIDLSKERNNTLIATNVVSLTVLNITPGARAELRLFDISKTPIRIPDDVGAGEEIHGLRLANVYLSNPSQKNSYLKLLVLKLTR